MSKTVNGDAVVVPIREIINAIFCALRLAHAGGRLSARDHDPSLVPAAAHRRRWVVEHRFARLPRPSEMSFASHAQPSS